MNGNRIAHLVEEDLIHDAHRDDFHHFTRMLQAQKISAIFSDEQKDPDIKDHENYQDLLENISLSEELQKYYVVSWITLCVQEGLKRKLPEFDLINLQRQTFLDLSETEGLSEIQEIMKRFENRLRSLYRKHRSNIEYSVNVRHAINLIRTRYNKKLSCEEIARSLHLSRSHLSRQFHKETGKTLTEYILQVKMEHAEEMLKTDAFSLQQISLSLGYDSYPYFSKRFKDHFGCSPEQFIAQYHK